MADGAFDSLSSLKLLNGKPKSYSRELTCRLRRDAARGFETTEAYLIRLCTGRIICDDGTLIRCGWPEDGKDKGVMILYGGTRRILIEPGAGGEKTSISDVSPLDAAEAAEMIIKRGRRCKQSIAAYHMFATLDTANHRSRVWPALEGVIPGGVVILGIPSDEGRLLYTAMEGYLRSSLNDWGRVVEAGAAATVIPTAPR